MFFWIVVVDIFLLKFRELVGCNLGAAFERADLGVVERNAERILRFGRAVGTGFARNVHRDDGVRLRILCVVNPGQAGGFLFDVRRFERNGRIASAIEALGTFHAKAEIPGRVCALRDEKDRIMARLGNGRAHG